MQTVLFFEFSGAHKEVFSNQRVCSVVDRKMRKGKARWKIYSMLIYSLYCMHIWEGKLERKSKKQWRAHETGTLKGGWLESHLRVSIQLFSFLFCGEHEFDKFHSSTSARSRHFKKGVRTLAVAVWSWLWNFVVKDVNFDNIIFTGC